ncbi:GyrI-like domain-containing protein [uncultured Cytophaga sp.]|uniref:GyrI-like domain-containing protein n=1 Tax=uncultured Cytophaga sp. TaxID=160238 RepID=UPI002638936D|nr:GyrI-like domain-containing protein [uncultured Cytophaga sp.]
MFSRIALLEEKQLVGISTQLSFSMNTTAELWKSFIPKVKNEFITASPDLYSVEVYPDGNFFNSFDPQKMYTKWATIEVFSLKKKVEDIESLLIPKGIYAIFIHTGLASEGFKTYEYIFNTWLPSSIYVLDNRPHFAVMSDRYSNSRADSEEEIWIPITKPNA